MGETTITQLTHVMRTIEDIDPDSKYGVLKRHLEIILDSYDVKKDDGVSEEIRSLRNYLGEENEV